MTKIRMALLAAFLFVVGTAVAQTPLKFHDGWFKIVQFTDLHYVVGNAKSDQAAQCIREVVMDEKPDLVFVTGDILYSSPGDTCLKAVLAVMESLNVPYCMVLGNHDPEQHTPVTVLYDLMARSPHCVMPARQGTSLDYVLPIQASRSARTAALVYGFQSYARSKMKGVGGYQWFTWRQLSWYRERSQWYKSKNGGRTLPAVAFMHYPLPEYNYALDNPQCPLYGARMERAYAPTLNSGMFTQMKEMGDVMAVFCGHDHDDDYSVMYYGVLLAHGRFSGGNTEYNHLRNGARVIVLHEGKRSLDTWIHERDGAIVNSTHFPADYVKDNWKARKGTR
jgi:hypothetical protein